MTIHSKYIGIIIFSFGIIQLCHSQGAPELSQNRAVLRYLSAVEISDIEHQQPEQFSNLNYYFTQSFEVSNLNSSQPLDLFSFYNIDLFNIKNFEVQRQQNSTVEINFKDKYLVVLKSRAELESVMTMSLDNILIKTFRPLPTYNNTGNVNDDYRIYKEELQLWIHDFPQYYRLFTSERNVTKIRINDFLQMGQERIDYYATRPNSYIIID